MILLFLQKIFILIIFQEMYYFVQDLFYKPFKNTSFAANIIIFHFL